jgi:hypothetical protein
MMPLSRSVSRQLGTPQAVKNSRLAVSNQRK